MTPKISERTLRKWRKEALEKIQFSGELQTNNTRFAEQILRMTQELLDQHLIKSRK